MHITSYLSFVKDLKCEWHSSIG